MQTLSFWGRLNVFRRLTAIEKELCQMDQNQIDLKNIVSKIKGDVSTFVADVNKKLSTLTPADPDQAKTIADAVAALTQLDEGVTAADAALNPPAETASTPEVPSTPISGSTNDPSSTGPTV